MFVETVSGWKVTSQNIRKKNNFFLVPGLRSQHFEHFLKSQNFNWCLVCPVITHWTYTSLSPWPLGMGWMLDGNMYWFISQALRNKSILGLFCFWYYKMCLKMEKILLHCIISINLIFLSSGCVKHAARLVKTGNKSW